MSQIASTAPSLHPEAIISRKEARHLSNPVGEELVLLNLDTGDYLGFNRVAAVIWQILEHPIKIRDLEQQLICRFDIDPVTCRSETMDFLDRINRLGLLSFDLSQS